MLVCVGNGIYIAYYAIMDTQLFFADNNNAL